MASECSFTPCKLRFLGPFHHRLSLARSQKEISTLASIVQAESQKTDERPRISGVYVNRMKLGMPLQADPTLVYATGDFTLKRILNVHKEIDLSVNMKETKQLQDLAINTIRFLSADAVQKANSGHPGLPMGAAAMAYTLWTRHLRHHPANPNWANRDRFVLSGGHGSMLLYSLLHLTGYDLPMEELKRFRQYDSKTPGHPEYGLTPGVEATTGPLGQGFANAVGMAMAAAHRAATFNRPGHDIIDHYTYAIVTDGDLMRCSYTWERSAISPPRRSRSRCEPH